MANTPRDVALTVSVETVGTEGVKDLRDKLQELAKQGGAAVPEFKQLGDEIARLGEQAKVTSAIRTLSSDIEAVATSQGEASAKAKALRDELSQLSDVTNKYATSEAAAKAELQSAQQILFEKSQALRTLKNDTDAAGKKVDDYKESVRNQTAELIKGKTEIRNLAEAYNVAKQASKDAATEEKQLADNFKFAASAAEELKGQLDAKNQSLREAKTQLEAMGVATNHVADVETTLLEKYKEVADAIEETTAAHSKATEEAKQAATAAKEAADAKIAAEKEYANRIGVINAQIAIARKAERDTIIAAEKALNDERVAAEKATADERVAAEKSAQALLVSETKRANDERLLAEKAYRDACEEEGKRYANKLDVINAQIANSQKAANLKMAADAKQLADERIAEEKRVEAAAKAVADSLDTVGVRSAANIKAEIQKVRDSLELLKSTGTLTGNELDSAFAQGGKQIKELERELRGVNNELTLADRGANLFKTSMGQFAAGNVVANGVMFVVEKVAELGRAFITTMIQGEQLSRGMNAIYGDSKLVASQIDFLRKTSVETGVSFTGVTTEFVKFSASMNSANIPLEQSNALFKAVTGASVSLGLGTEATAGALNALAQMASKGVVSMEELRQQLGDRLPGVMGLTAKAMGITEGELVKLVESGKLATRDFIGPFTEGMKTLQGTTDGVMPTLGKFQSALATMAQGIGEAGGLALMVTTIKAVGASVSVVSLGISTLSEVIFGLAKAVGVATAALFSWTNPLEALGKIVGDATGRLTGQAVALQTVAGLYDEAAVAAKANGAVVAAAAEETRKAEAVVKSHAATQGMAQVAIDLASNATLNATGKLSLYLVESEKLIAQQGLQTEGLKRHVEAVKSEGDELVTLAKLSGNSTMVREAEAKAANLQSDALEKVRASQQAEVDLLIVQRKHIQDDAAARKLSNDEIKTQIDVIDKKLVPANAELEQMQKAAGAAKAEAMARNLVSEALKDNSKNLEEYGEAVTAAKANVEEIIAQEKQGILTKNDVKVAQEALSRVTYLYNDALNDSIRAVELETRAKNAALQVASATATAGQSHYDSLAKQARALGDTATATYYDIEAKKQAIKVLELKMQMEALQNAAALAEIELKRKLIDASTDEGQAKLKILDIEKQLIQVKNINNDAIKDQIRSIDAEITALRIGNVTKQASASVNAADSSARATNTGAIDAQTSALERQNAATERSNAAIAKAAELERQRIGVDAQGFSADKSGNRIVAGGDLTTRTGIVGFLKAAGVTDEAQAKSIANEFADSNGNVIYANNPGQKNYGGDTISMALLKAAEKSTFKNVPKFASGGYHEGGVRLVGEKGPEIEVTGPSRIMNADQTKEILERPEKLRKELELMQAKVAEFEKLATKGGGDAFYQSLGFGGGRLQLMQELSRVKGQTEFKRNEIDSAESERNELKRQKARAIADDIESWGNRATIASVMNSDAAKREGLDFGSVQAAMTGYESKAFAHEIKTIAGQIAPNGSGKSVSFADIENYYKKEKNSVLSGSEATTARKALSESNARMTSVPLPQSAMVAQNSSTSGGKTYTVNINLNGATTSVNTATDNDATALLGVLQSLQKRAS